MRILIVALTLSMGIAFSQTNHYGAWKGKDETGKEASLTFRKDGYFKLDMGNKVFESDDTTFTKSKITAKYIFDYTKKPIWLDIQIYDSNKHLVNTVKSIVRFEQNKMVWAVGAPPSQRPKKINLKDRKHTIILLKVE
jgi:hypothetical protein